MLLPYRSVSCLAFLLIRHPVSFITKSSKRRFIRFLTLSFSHKMIGSGVETHFYVWKEDLLCLIIQQDPSA